jgi:hypothetical protein
VSLHHAAVGLGAPGPGRGPLGPKERRRCPSRAIPKVLRPAAGIQDPEAEEREVGGVTLMALCCLTGRCIFGGTRDDAGYNIR